MRTCLLTLLVYFISCNTGIGQDGRMQNTDSLSAFVGKYQPEVMILGVYHFHNPGLDSYKEQFHVDILSAEKQHEVELLLDRIEKFKPTKILIEQDRIAADSTINARYAQYLAGEFSIDKKANEIYQLGFKLAKRLGHERIYCSDATAEWFGTSDIDWDNFDEEGYLKSKNQYYKSERYDYNKLYRYSDSLKTAVALVEYLWFLNKPEVALKSHQHYLTQLILPGAGDNYYGADSVARWYRRNIRIFSNMYDFADFDKEDRILLIYGAGHIWQLRQLISDSPDFKYVEVNDYLQAQ